MSQYHNFTRRYSFKIHLAKFQQEHILLETELLNLSNPEKSVVSAGKLFHILTIRTLKKLRLLEQKHRCLCNIICVTA